MLMQMRVWCRSLGFPIAHHCLSYLAPQTTVWNKFLLLLNFWPPRGNVARNLKRNRFFFVFIFFILFYLISKARVFTWPLLLATCDRKTLHLQMTLTNELSLAWANIRSCVFVSFNYCWGWIWHVTLWNMES